ncbi:hypothetical protein AAK706_07355 [Erysipelotrichaceae bacterium 66-17]
MRNDKYLRVQKASRIGTFGDTFRRNLDWIPEDIINKLNAQDIAALVDQFCDCYGRGKQDGRREMKKNPYEANIMLGED